VATPLEKELRAETKNNYIESKNGKELGKRKRKKKVKKSELVQ